MEKGYTVQHSKRSTSMKKVTVYPEMDCTHVVNLLLEGVFFGWCRAIEEQIPSHDWEGEWRAGDFFHWDEDKFTIGTAYFDGINEQGIEIETYVPKPVLELIEKIRELHGNGVEMLIPSKLPRKDIFLE